MTGEAFGDVPPSAAPFRHVMLCHRLSFAGGTEPTRKRPRRSGGAV